MDDDGYGPTSHVAAARAAGFNSSGEMRFRHNRESSMNRQSSSQQQHTTTTTTLTTYEEQLQERRNQQRKKSSSKTQRLGQAAEDDDVDGGETGGDDVGGSATFVPEGGAGGAWSIARALQVLKSDNRELHSEASEALAEMFAASPPAGVEIIMKGGVGAITSAIEAGHAAFAAGAAALLHMFASSQVTGRRVKADEDVLSGRTPAVVLSAMRRYPNNTAVIQWGAMTLWALAKDNPRCKLAIMGVHVAGGGTSGDVLMEALTTQGTTSELVAKALLGCMMTLATNSVEWQEGWVELSAPTLIMQTLDAHRGITFRGEFDGLRGWLRDNA